MMRQRADRDRMLKRVHPRWPVCWVIPPHLVADQDRLDEELRNAVRQVRVPYGCDVELTLLLQNNLLSDSRPAYVVQIRPAPRRDTSGRRETRWLSETPRGPRDD